MQVGQSLNCITALNSTNNFLAYQSKILFTHAALNSV